MIVIRFFVSNVLFNFRLCRWLIVLWELLVCSVVSIRWLVILVCNVSFVVFVFWIFFIMIMFGLWCSSECSVLVNFMCLVIFREVILFSWFFIGFLILKMVFLGKLFCIFCRIVLSVVDFLLLVGLVMMSMLLVWCFRFCNCFIWVVFKFRFFSLLMLCWLFSKWMVILGWILE